MPAADNSGPGWQRGKGTTSITNKRSPVRVFIAEDNPILLQGLERALTAYGYVVRTAADGMAIMELLGEDSLPHVLLLDVMMPGMSGVEVLEAVRADDRTAFIPVILITAAVDEAPSLPALQFDSVELMLKPFRLTDLLARIDAQVESSMGAVRFLEASPLAK